MYENPGFYLSFLISGNLGPVGAKKDLEPQNQTKTFTHLVDLLGHMLSLNFVSNFLDLGYND